MTCWNCIHWGVCARLSEMSYGSYQDNVQDRCSFFTNVQLLNVLDDLNIDRITAHKKFDGNLGGKS